MGKAKTEANARRHDFLLTLFPDKKQEYAELPMNGFVLVRQHNKSVGRWEVAIYTNESFKKREAFKKTYQESLIK